MKLSLIVLSISILISACTMNSEQNKTEELKKIEVLHQQDMKASKKGDYATLQSLLTEDAVMMPPNQPLIQGSEQIDQSYQLMEEAMKEINILEYQLDFEEVKILGNFAFEWGTIRGKSQTGDGEVVETSYKILRILKKTEEGGWKIHRSIWNNNPSKE